MLKKVVYTPILHSFLIRIIAVDVDTA